MGYAKIVSGGPSGRYSISLDYGESTRTALIAACNANVAQLTVKVAAAQLKVTDADAKEAAQRAIIAQAQQDYIDLAATLPPGSPKPSTAAIRFGMEELRKMRIAHEGLRRVLDLLQFDLKVAQQRAQYWISFNASETRNAWCADLTEDAAPGKLVATADIPGESNLLLIAPGARTWAPSDGVPSARELMSPEQAFFNAAILPGWQKFKPTYRWGTITGLNYEQNLADVTVAAAVSSAQSLNVNQSTALTNVPVVYMSCNAQPFNVGDRVVVQFTGQDWASPKVIGFLTDPKPCVRYTLRYRFRGGVSTPDVVQYVYLHRDAEPVVAPPPFPVNTAYSFSLPPFYGGGGVFEGWSDGAPDLIRQDKDIQADLDVTANYSSISGFVVTTSSFGLRDTETGTEYIKVVNVIYPTGYTFVSGRAPGFHDSGYTTFDNAVAFMVGETSTCSIVRNGKTFIATFVYRRNPADTNQGGAYILDSISG